jgi:hypothetical protein
MNNSLQNTIFNKISYYLIDDIINIIKYSKSSKDLIDLMEFKDNDYIYLKLNKYKKFIESNSTNNKSKCFIKSTIIDNLQKFKYILKSNYSIIEFNKIIEKDIFKKNIIILSNELPTNKLQKSDLHKIQIVNFNQDWIDN